MKTGETIHIRLNPEDAMGCIDLCKAAGIYIDGMSFAQVARCALSGMLENMRVSGVIPRRDGYEYIAMMQPFGGKQNSRKLQITSVIEQAEASRLAAGLSASVMQLPAAHHADAESHAQDYSYSKSHSTTGHNDTIPARQRRLIKLSGRIDELNWKRENDSLNFSDADQQELYKLVEELNSV